MERPHTNGLHIQTVDHPTKTFYCVLNSDGYPVAVAGDRADAARFKRDLETQNPKPNEVDIFA